MDQEFARWCDAVKAACAEANEPVQLWREGHAYSWTPVDPHRIREGFDVIHRAFLLCESLRPSWLRPSPHLAKLLEMSA